MNFLGEEKGTIIYIFVTFYDRYFKSINPFILTGCFLFPLHTWRNQRSAHGLYSSTSLSQYSIVLSMLLYWFKYYIIYSYQYIDLSILYTYISIIYSIDLSISLNAYLLKTYSDLYSRTTEGSFACLQDHHLVWKEVGICNLTSQRILISWTLTGNFAFFKASAWGTLSQGSQTGL